jgi:hypothetical protein
MLSIFGVVLGTVGTTLSLVTFFMHRRERSERLLLFCVCKNLGYYRVFNPTVLPIEIRAISIHKRQPHSSEWKDEPDFEVSREPLLLEPLRSHTIKLSDREMPKLGESGRLQIESGSGRIYRQSL